MPKQVFQRRPQVNHKQFGKQSIPGGPNAIPGKARLPGMPKAVKKQQTKQRED